MGSLGIEINPPVAFPYKPTDFVQALRLAADLVAGDKLHCSLLISLPTLLNPKHL